MISPALEEGLRGPRAESWRWDLLDRSGAVVGVLDGARGGKLDGSVGADVRWTGSLDWSGRWADQPEWETLRLRPVYVAVLGDGTDFEMPMGVYRTATPRLSNLAGGIAAGNVDLYDETSILREDARADRLSLDAGTPVAPVVRDLVRGAVRGARVALPDDDTPLRSGMSWDPGTSVLRIVNDLLDTIGWWAIYADGKGVLRSGPRDRPSDRPVQWHHVAGPGAVHSGGWTLERDTWSVPNRVICISEGDADAEGMVAERVLDDLDDEHPLSYARRGRWVTSVVEGVQAATLEVLAERADRLIRASLRPSVTVKVKHAALPLAINDRVRFTDASGATGDYVLRSLRVECVASSMWESELLEVVT